LNLYSVKPVSNVAFTVDLYRYNVAYGYRGLTIKHVVVNDEWLKAATSAEPMTTGLFKGDEPLSEPEPEPPQSFGERGGALHVESS
jgi:hypothetical protein